MEFILANTNGRLHDAREASISPLDRGFLYGDAVYEVWRTVDGVLFAAQEHWERMLASAAALGFSLPFTWKGMWTELRRTVAAFRVQSGWTGELNIRLQITRGAGALNLDPAAADAPNWVFYVRKMALFEPLAHGGVKLSIVRQLRRNHPLTLNPAWKTGNYLNNVLCLAEGRSRGADEVVILNLADEVSEAAVCNLGFVKDGVLINPPLPAGMLAGITRGQLLQEVAARAGIESVERTVREEDLPTFAEAFLISTTRTVLPAESIDQYRFTTGPDSVAMRLRAAFAAYHQDYVRAHPEYRVDG